MGQTEGGSKLDTKILLQTLNLISTLTVDQFNKTYRLNINSINTVAGAGYNWHFIQ